MLSTSRKERTVKEQTTKQNSSSTVENNRGKCIAATHIHIHSLYTRTHTYMPSTSICTLYAGLLLYRVVSHRVIHQTTKRGMWCRWQGGEKPSTAEGFPLLLFIGSFLCIFYSYHRLSVGRYLTLQLDLPFCHVQRVGEFGLLCIHRAVVSPSK
jgi:hypothetical protein